MLETPGYTPDFEQAVIAAALQSKAAREVTCHLSTSDFANPIHGQVWGAVQSLHGRGEGVDRLTVAALLEQWGQIDDTKNTLDELCKASVTPDAAKTYAGYVFQASLCRQTLRVAGELGTLSASGLSLTEDEYRKAYNETTQKGLPPSTQSLIQRADHGVADLFSAMENPGDLGVALRVHSPNVASAGGMAAMLYPGMISTVIGGSGDGKTAWITQVAEHAARDGATVCIVDGEITPALAHARRMQRYSGVRADRQIEQMYTGETLTVDEWTSLYAGHASVEKWLPNLHYLYTPTSGTSGIWGIIDQLRELHRETPIQLLALDYIQLFAAADPGRNEAQAISWALQIFKNLCGEIGAHGYVGSQFSNEAIKTPGPRTQYGAKGSGDIGAKSNLVLTIDRPMNNDASPTTRHWQDEVIYIEPGERDVEAKFRIDKNSFGKSGRVVKMFFDGRFYTWRDVVMEGRNGSR